MKMMSWATGLGFFFFVPNKTTQTFLFIFEQTARYPGKNDFGTGPDSEISVTYVIEGNLLNSSFSH